MDKTEMMRLLHAVADGSVSPEDAALKLKTQPFEEITARARQTNISSALPGRCTSTASPRS